MNDPTPAIGPVSDPLDPAAGRVPSDAAVAQELETIITSDVFTGAARQQRLLKHLVNKKLNGGVGELKEYTLGVEVFDRGDDFDPRLDPIVRVEASRLRSRLQKYYEAAGKADLVRISLPRGGYVPSFTVLTEESSPPASVAAIPAPSAIAEPVPVPPPQVPHRTSVRWLLPALLAFALIGLLIAAVFAFRRDRASATYAGGPDFIRFRRVTSDEALCMSPTFSPDAKKIVYARSLNGNWDLYERDLSSLNAVNLTSGSKANNIQPAWSPDGSSIAFHSSRDNGGIFLMNVADHTISRLTDVGFLPSWSPDSKKIVFSTASFGDPGESGAPEASTLQVVDVATKQITPLGSSNVVFSAMQPAWSPDGKRIAFWRTDRDGSKDIWTIAADPQNPRPTRVTQDAWTDWSPAWAPDGKYLYFASDRSGAMNLWRVRIEQDSGEVLSKPEAVTTPSSYSGWISFAPKGNEFAYVHRLVSTQLYRFPFSIEKGVDLNQRSQLTAGERIVHEPETSPDGNWIVVRVQDPQEDLALLHPDGSSFHRLTDDRFNDRNPHWAPDGSYIAFTSNRSGRYEVWAVNPDGSHPRQLSNGGVISYAWTPDGTLIGYLPNNKSIVLLPKGKPMPDLDVPSALRPLAWSPNGNAIAARMQSSAFEWSALFVFFPQSQDYWQIAPKAPYASEVWLHDGHSLLFSSADGIFLADTQTRNIKEEIKGFPHGIHSRFAVSHDDDALFLVESGDQDDVWIAAE